MDEDYKVEDLPVNKYPTHQSPLRQSPPYNLLQTDESPLRQSPPCDLRRKALEYLYMHATSARQIIGAPSSLSPIPARLLSLPYEIRCMIWKHAVATNQDLCPITNLDPSLSDLCVRDRDEEVKSWTYNHPSTISIFLMSKKVYSEMSTLYPPHNRRLQPLLSLEICSPKKAVRFLKSATTPQRSQIKIFKVKNIDMNSDTWPKENESIFAALDIPIPLPSSTWWDSYREDLSEPIILPGNAVHRMDPQQEVAAGNKRLFTLSIDVGERWKLDRSQRAEERKLKPGREADVGPAPTYTRAH